MGSKRQPTLAETWSGKQDPGFDFPGGSASNLKGGSSFSRGQGRGRGTWRKNEGSHTGNGRGQGPSRAKKRGGGGRGRGRGNSIRIPDSVISLEDDDDELCHQALGQFELADTEIAKALEAGAAAERIPGFDETAGETWIYPTNRPVRDYQFSIAETALFHNTFVSLPTGLGKTFIAAVVMYNYYRWYPNEIIVFMAPTRPLVAQQLDACHNIVGINPAVTVELTGQILPAKRETLWKEKRVFFLTPQVMQSDINRNFCIAEKVRCVVIDEAHKAVGNHSYAQVVSSIIKKNSHFRVLALSATPGNDVDAIQQVFKNLLISRVELRSDKSPDVLPYVHDREVETRVVSMDPFLVSIHEQMKDIFQVYTGKLMQQNILPRNGSSFGAYQLLQSRQRFRASPPPRLGQVERGYVEVTFSTCISLARSVELLNIHGLRSFYSFLQGLLLREKGSAVVASELRKKGVDAILKCVQEKLNISVENSSFNISASGLFDSLNESANPSLPQVASTNIDDYLQSHPKMKILKDIVVDHFKTFALRNESTRVMIFSQYRDSVQEIGNLLNLLKPQVKPMVFMGQAKTAGAGGRGLKQKEQVQVVEMFREGGFNVLVATSVGEEGLDIGDVDLIICFDSNKSPTRNIQRMGRTGRKRRGRIIFLLTEGREERLYRFSLTQQSSLQKNILDPAKLKPYLYLVSPKMVPAGIDPQCFKMSIILSSEHENYTNHRKMFQRKSEEVTLDDSDFIRPGNPTMKKKALKGPPRKTKTGTKKSDGCAKSSASEVNTIARCLELMEMKRSTQSKPLISTETIVIDDEHQIYTPPMADFDHHSVAIVDDDYDVLCTLFDIREVNAQSTAAACVHVPLQSGNFLWKTEYNDILHEDFLLSDFQFQTVKELVDSSVYAGSIDRYCKCGNPGSTDISLAENLDLANEFEEEFGHSFRSEIEPSKRFTKSPVRKSLSELQSVALPVIRKSLNASPIAEANSLKSSTPVVNSSTPVGARREVFDGLSKYFRADPHKKDNNVDEFDAGFIFDDENDSIFTGSWLGELETTATASSTPSCALRIVNNQTVNTSDVNRSTKPTSLQVKLCKYSEDPNAADDSSTASESEFAHVFIPSEIVSEKVAEACHTFKPEQSSYKSKHDSLPEMKLQESRIGSSNNSDQSNQLKTFLFEPNKMDLESTKSSPLQATAKLTSPDLGLRRRKFIFKKKTSGLSFNLSQVKEDASMDISTQIYNDLPASNSSSNILPKNSAQERLDQSSIIQVKPKILCTPKKYNPREIFSRVIDDSEIDFIPGTSSDEEEPSKCGDKCVEDANGNKDFDSDSTSWDPDELPATPPDAYKNTQGADLSSKLEKDKAGLSKRDTDFVFSPDRRNFPLASQFRNTFNRIVTTDGSPVKISSVLSSRFKSKKSCSLASSPKDRLGASRVSISRNQVFENSVVLSQPVTKTNVLTQDFAPEVQYLCTSPKPTSMLDTSNSIHNFETPKSKQTTPPIKKFKFVAKPNRTVNMTASPTLSESPSPIRRSYLSTSEVNQSGQVFSTPARASTCRSSYANFSSPIITSCLEMSSPDSEDIVFRKRGAARRIIDSDERLVATKPPARKLSKMKRKGNPFLLDEAAGTSDDTSLEDFDESNYVDDSFVCNGDDEEDELITNTQQQVMYLQSVKDIIPVRAGRIEEPLLPPAGQYNDDEMMYLNDSFCDEEVEYADVGVYTQCMIAAREEIEKEKSSGKPKRRLRPRR
ncbi:unnamed protein product [Allacma fusca]|uniref:Fanconi anemia group M protein n=1 Tax=Allacma fusca TaxID=39272 RepID=A0A8J2LUD3_9HEXA|nr:unnamed protein product [Allacma fusca]